MRRTNYFDKRTITILKVFEFIVLWLAMMLGFCGNAFLNEKFEVSAWGGSIRVTINDEITDYSDIASAWTKAQEGTEEHPAEIQLFANINIAEELTVGADDYIKFDVYNKTLTQTSSDKRIFNVKDGGVLEIQDSLWTGNASITGGSATNGGAVYVADGGECILWDVNITGNSATNGGAVYVADGGTFKMYDGKITSNTTTDDGGAVYVADGGTFIMTDGDIASNTAESNGGGVYVADGGTFTMTGGKITDNKAFAGGGVYVYAGTFNMTPIESGDMSGGQITVNHAYSNGGAVYVNSGTFNMSFGTIYKNTAANYPGVYVINGTTINMSGGEIRLNDTTNKTGNKEKYQCGIYMSGTMSKLKLSGNPIIDNGITTIKVEGDYFSTRVQVVDAMTEGASINFANKNTADSTLIAGVGDGYTLVEDDIKAFNVYDSKYVELDSANNTLVVKDRTEGAVGLTFDGNTNYYTNLGSAFADAKALATTAETRALVAIHEDMIVKSSYTIDDGDFITLDLNGYDIKADYIESYLDNEIIEVNTGADFILNDSNPFNRIRYVVGLGNNFEITDDDKSADAKYTAIYGGMITNGGGVKVVCAKFTMNGGNITGNLDDIGAGVAIYAGANFILNGGTISNNYASSQYDYDNQGGGVYMNGYASDGGEEGCTFTMTGGAITGNRAYYYSQKSYGGGVYISYGGTFTMEGGTISNNSADYGNGVCVDGAYSTFIMNGGAISGNTYVSDYKKYGGAVCLENSGEFAMTDGSITNNDGHGVKVNGVYGEYPKFSMTGGEITGNKGGVDVYYNGKFTISGNPIIKDNQTDGVQNNVLLREGAYITITGELNSDAVIKVDTTTSNPIAKGETKAGEEYQITNQDMAKFTYANPLKLLGLSGNSISLSDPIAIVQIGEEITPQASLTNAINYAKSQATSSELRAYITLKNNIVSNDTYTIESGDYITLDLGMWNLGFNDYSDTRIFTIDSGADFEIKSSNTEYYYWVNGYIIGDYLCKYGDITMWDHGENHSKWKKTLRGMIKNTGGIESNGTFTLTSGTILGNETKSDGIIYVGDGEFTMNGGSIINNKTYANGGGVYVDTGAKFTMNGGNISRNGANNGGGVYSNNGIVNISGGNILDNKACEEAGGIYLFNPNTFLVSGNVNISNNVNIAADTSKYNFEYYTKTTPDNIYLGDNGNNDNAFNINGAIASTAVIDLSNIHFEEGYHLASGNAYTIQSSDLAAFKLSEGQCVRIDTLNNKLTVGQKTVGSANVSIEDWTYGDSANDPTISSSTHDTSGVTYLYTGTTASGTSYSSSTAPTNAGSYTIKATLQENGSYLQTTASANFTINAKEITILWTNTTLTYNGDEQKPTATVSNLEGSDSCLVTVTGGQTNASDSSYTATASAVNNKNYTVSSENTTTFTIGKADPTYTVPSDVIAKEGQTLDGVALPTGWTWEDKTESVGDFGAKHFNALFTPTDTINYNTAIESISVKVVHSCSGIIFDNLLASTTDATTLGASGTVTNYVLTADRNYEKGRPTIYGTVNICLNGFNWAGAYFTVGDGAILNIYDCSASGGTLTPGGDNFFKLSGTGELNIYGGNFNAGNHNAIRASDFHGSISINGGNFKSSSIAIVIYEGSSASLELNDGSISSSGNSAIVYLGSGNIYLSGTTITTNADQYDIVIHKDKLIANNGKTGSELIEYDGVEIVKVKIKNSLKDGDTIIAGVNDDCKNAFMISEEGNSSMNTDDTVIIPIYHAYDNTLKYGIAVPSLTSSSSVAVDFGTDITLSTTAVTDATYSWFKVTGFGDTYLETQILNQSTNTLVLSNVADSGKYIVKVTLENNSVGVSEQVTVTINKIAPTTPTSLTATYGDTLEDITLPTGWAWDDNTASVGNVGTNTFNASYTAADNYSAVTSLSLSVTVEKKEAVLLWTAPNDLVYDKTAKTASASVTNKETGDIVTVMVVLTSNCDNVNVGSFTFTATGLSNSNYKLPSFVTSGSYTITPKEIGITWTNTNLTYNGGEQAPTATATGLEGSDTCTITVTGGQTNASDSAYTATASSLSNDNYKLPATKIQTFTITKADYDMSGITFANATYIYDGEVKTLSISGTLPTGVDVTYTTNTLTDCGAVIATAKFTIADSANYNAINDKTATLTIDKLDITSATVGAFGALTYTGNAQTPTATVTIDGLTVTGAWSNVTAVADKSTFTASGNFTGIIADKDVSMAKASVTAPTADNTTFTYNGNEQTYALATSDLYTIANNIQENAGTYTVTIDLNDTANYEWAENSVTSFDFTIAKADYDMSGITFENASVDYSGQEQGLTIGGELPAGLDGISLTVSYSSGLTESGTKIITATFATTSTNYNVPTAMTAELTVLPEKETSLLGVIVLLALLNVVAIALIALKIVQDKRGKKNNDFKTNSFAVLPFMSAVVVGGHIPAVVCLSILLVINIGVLVCLYVKPEFAQKIKAKASEILSKFTNKANKTDDTQDEVAVTKKEAFALEKEKVQENIEVFDDEEVFDDDDVEVFDDEDEEVQEEVKVIADEDNLIGRAIIVRYNKSFTAKLMQAPEFTKQSYSDIKNAILGYNKVKSRISWSYDSINIGKMQLAKFNVRGKSLYLYMALDAFEFKDTKYKLEKVDTKRYAKVSARYKISSKRKLKYALELVEILASKHGLTKLENSEQVDYVSQFGYAITQNLVARNLIKELISKEDYEALKKIQEKQVVNANKREFISVLEASKIISDQTAITLLNVKKEAVVKAVKKVSAIINIDTLSDNFDANDTVNLTTLKDKKLVPQNTTFIKILARGVISKPLKVESHSFSCDAIKMILLTGGEVTKII